LRQELELTRKRGYSTDAEEFMAGMAAVAVPIRDIQDRLVSTLSVHAPLQRLGLSDLVAKVDTLQAGARELSELLNS
jgi:DNA-binding IclR family transcriptional regulator